MKQPKYAAYGQLLRQARQERALSQIEVADAVGITSSWYARIEAGSVLCSLMTLAALRKTLHVDANALLKALGYHSKQVEGMGRSRDQEPERTRRRQEREHASGPYKRFSRAFRPARLQKQFTQSMVAEAVGCSRTYYYCIETGRQLPSVQVLARLHDCLEFDANELLDEVDSALLSRPAHYHFGTYIQRARNRKSETIATAAEAAGCSIEKYQSIEAGARLPTLAELVRLHRLLSFNADHALRRIDLERLVREDAAKDANQRNAKGI